MDHLETAISGDPSHNQLPNPDTIAYTSKILLKRPRYSCHLWEYPGAEQTQKWMLAVNYWMDHQAPNGGARESTQGAGGICNPIGGTTIWTNQYPPELVSLAAYVSEDGLVGHQCYNLLTHRIWPHIYLGERSQSEYKTLWENNLNNWHEINIWHKNYLLI